MSGRVLRVAVVVVLLIGGCRVPLSSAASHSPGTSFVPRTKALWSSCDDGFECATIQVPLDYSDPQGRKISLALIRKPATDPSSRIGSLLMNPGGPGESGVDFLTGSADAFANLNTRFDLVSWDTRGVGASSAVDCMTGPQLDALLALDPVLDDPQEKAAYIAGQKSFVSACWHRDGDILPFLDSRSTGLDMEQIRIALGDPKLTYMGFSYGTYIAQWYAHLFPGHVRAMVLDGVVPGNANSSSPQDSVGGAEALEASLEAYAGTCAGRSTCPYPGSSQVEAKVEQAMARLDAKPIPVGNRQLTRGLGVTAIFGAMYDEGSWPDLDRALAALERGDGSQMLMLADTFNERNDDGTYATAVNGGLDATNCIDAPATTADISQYDSVGPALAKASPLFGPFIQYDGLACAFWPVEGKGLDVPSVEGTPPLLLIGATGDPVTPYSWAREVHGDIPGSVLITRDGGGHTSYGLSDCIDSAADQYLINLVVPASGLICSS